MVCGWRRHINPALDPVLAANLILPTIMFLSNSETTRRSSEIDEDDAGNSGVHYKYSPRFSKLLPRKGGGGHGGGHASGEGGHSGSSPASEHGASSAFTSSRSASGFAISKSGKTTTTATAYSNGGGKPFVLGSNSLFSGRQAGGGSRVRRRRLGSFVCVQLLIDHGTYRAMSMGHRGLVADTRMAGLDLS